MMMPTSVCACVSTRAGTCLMRSYLTVRIGEHPGEDFTQSLQLYSTAEQHIRLEKRRGPLGRVVGEVSRPT